MMLKKTKIVASISDLRCDEDFIRELFEAGMNVVRMNTAHANREGFEKLIANVRKVSNRIAILMDTKGPEVRTTDLIDGEPIPFHTGERVAVTGDPTRKTSHDCIAVSYPHFVHDLQIGETILIDDGDLELAVVEKDEAANKLVCEVRNEATLGNHKSVNVPGVRINLPSLTEKDRNNILYAIEKDIDFIAHSFVRNKQDVLDIRKILDEHHSTIKIIAKIENQEGVDNIDEILEVADGIMVARGDLGIEVPQERIPGIQRILIRKCVMARKPVIVATEVLGSMVSSPVPTRAEASDCANAVLDGADATMTSNETAVGKYPAVTVNTMSRISTFATEHGFDRIPELKNLDMSSTGAVSSAAVDLADKLNAKAIVAYTQTGSTVHRVSRERPATPIYGITNNEHPFHWLALSWGTESFLVDEDYHDKSRKDLMVFTDKVLKDAGKVSDGDKIVVLSSAQGEHQPGRTDSIYVHTVGACD